jgi:ubiquinone/menaquinone biosynthesis C-methylase UbiE
MFEVRNHQILMNDPHYTYLDLGAGTGRTASEAEQFLNSDKKLGHVNVIATGIKKRPEWNTHQNSKNISWEAVEFEKLASKVPSNSVNFILSNFGIGHAQNLNNALLQVHQVLKKGGRILYSYDAPYTAAYLYPAGFKPVREHAVIYKSEPSEDSQKIRVVIYLEKI